MKHNVKGNYRAVFSRNGHNENIVLVEGEVVELDRETAAFIRRDCPGVIVRAKGVKKGAEKKPATGE